MGYYTDLTLIFEPKKQEIVDRILNLKGDNDLWFIYNAYSPNGDSVKFYEEMENFIQEFTKEFPDVEFTLEGQGEETNDHWIHKYKDGELLESYYCSRYPIFNLEIEPEDAIIHEIHEAPWGNNFKNAYNYDPEGFEWNDHEGEMKNLSKRYPDVLFTLEVKINEPIQIWKKYFKGGKSLSREASISFEPYDEDLLT